VITELIDISACERLSAYFKEACEADEIFEKEEALPETGSGVHE